MSHPKPDATAGPVATCDAIHPAPPVFRRLAARASIRGGVAVAVLGTRIVAIIPEEASLKIRTVLGAAWLSVCACHAHADDRALRLLVSPSVHQTSLPSASGLSLQGDALYAVGDDSPYLYQLDPRFNIAGTLLIKPYPVVGGRIPKSVKPDFEAMAVLADGATQWHAVIGSGSKAIVREVGFLIHPASGTRIEFKLGALYASLTAAAGFTSGQTLNIEGLAVARGHVYLLNRANPDTANIVFRIRQDEFLAYAKGQRATVSRVDAFVARLPKVGGYEAGLSGAEYWADAGSLVFTASVEATGDPINDGAILGSFVGLIELDRLESGRVLDLRADAVPVLKNGAPLITKVESIAIRSADDDAIVGVLASDKDDGTSEFFDFALEIVD